MEENAKNPELEKIHQILQKVKHDKEMGIEYMKWFEREQLIREEAQKEANERAEKEKKRADDEKKRADDLAAQLEVLKKQVGDL